MIFGFLIQQKSLIYNCEQSPYYWKTFYFVKNLLIIQQREMYAVLGSIFTGSLGFYIGYNQLQFIQQSKVTKIENNQIKPTHTFSSSTIQPYTQLRKEQDKYIIYSKYHKCQLSTHQLINKAASSVKSNDDAVPQQKVGEENYKELFEKQYKGYAYQLINNKKCNSVELIHGPIFSKDSWSKNEENKNIYFSKVLIDKKGQWIADRYYAIVVCNRNEGSYFNGFQHRKPNVNYMNKFQILNNLTTIKKLQEQTGLVFNLTGGQLTMQDYQGLSKIRKFGSSQQSKDKNVTTENITAETAQD